MTTVTETQRVAETVDGDAFARFRAGQDVGHSEWLTVDQGMIDRFSEATYDSDPIHVDPAWATSEGPYGHTIAFGFLTMSLLTVMLRSASEMDGRGSRVMRGHYLNYGFDRLRLVSPVPVNSRIRSVFRVIESKVDEKSRIVVKFGATVEIEGQQRPALIAEWLAVWVPPAGGPAA